MRYTIRLTAVILFALMGAVFIYAAQAATKTATRGDMVGVRCVSPTTYADETPISNGTHIKTRYYATQTIPMIGTEIATADNCAATTFATDSMALGDWYVYGNAEDDQGRPGAISAFSSSDSFALGPDQTLPPSAPTGLTVTIIPKAVVP